MIHARPDSAGRFASQPPRGRRLGLAFALLVMCLAVVPHVTLAASMMRTAMPGHAHTAALAAVVDKADTAAPCHEDKGASPSHPAQAPCCIVGCGLIAEAPVAPFLPLAASWSRAIPPPAAPVRGLSPEPAEHPPRPGAPIS